MKLLIQILLILLGLSFCHSQTDGNWWDTLPQTEGGLIESHWLGEIDTDNDPWIQSSNFGWIYLVSSGDWFWVWDFEVGWFWVNPSFWPTIYILSGNNWFYVLEDTLGDPDFKVFDYRFNQESVASKLNSWGRVLAEGSGTDLRIELENSRVGYYLTSEPDAPDNLLFQAFDKAGGQVLGLVNNLKSNLNNSYRVVVDKVSEDFIEIRYLKTHRYQRIRLFKNWDVLETESDPAYVGFVSDPFVNSGDTATHVIYGAEGWLADRQFVSHEPGLNKSDLLPVAPDFLIKREWAPLESLSYKGYLILGAVDANGEGTGVVLKDQNLEWLQLQQTIDRKESSDMLSWYFIVPEGGSEGLISRGKEIVDAFLPMRNSLMGIRDFYGSYPQAGEVFRDYIWNTPFSDAGGSLRVGGQNGVFYPDRGSNFGYINTAKTLNDPVDLEYAIRAEVIIEKVLSHDRTSGFGIEVNGNEWIYLQDPLAMPEPTNEYYHHVFQTVPIPLSYLRSGAGNQFRLRVDADHPWGWPQHLVYGVHFRVYYDPQLKTHPVGTITSPINGDVLGDSVALAAEAASPNGSIDRVEFLGLYEGINWEGDGIYRQWHHFYFQGNLKGILGRDQSAPFQANWDTRWIPDQPLPMQMMARIVDSTGLVYMTEPITDLTFDRDYEVELAKPYDVPIRWVNRTGQHEEKFFVRRDLDKATHARLAWTSWSPGYMNGVSVNNRQVITKEGPLYNVFNHEVDFDPTLTLRPGDNSLRTGATSSSNVHGMEVMWPGIQVLIRYSK